MNTQRLVDTFLKYVQIDSESFNEGDMAKAVAEDLKQIGCDVYTDNCAEIIGGNGSNVYAVLPAENSHKEPILFSAHMDTVSPGKNVKPVMENGVIRSDGTTVLGSDDKSGIAAVIEALRTIKEENTPHPQIEVVFTVCEEQGLLGSKNLDYSRITAKKCAVLDSSGDAGKIIIGAPGQAKLKGYFVGRSAHAGVSPQDGVSAVQVAAEAVSRMKLLRIDSETTANIGTLKAEYATNIVPEKVLIIAEARSRSKEKLEYQKSHMMSCISDACRKYGGGFDGSFSDMYSAYSFDENDEFIAQIKDACKSAGVKPFTDFSGGGSDANNFNLKGIKSVVLGTGMSKVHSVKEEITIENLENTAKIVLQLAKG